MSAQKALKSINSLKSFKSLQSVKYISTHLCSPFELSNIFLSPLADICSRFNHELNSFDQFGRRQDLLPYVILLLK